MSSGFYDNVEQYIVRKQPSISVDYLEIVPYPKHIIITWNVISSTQNIITEILCEDFCDLIITVNLYRGKENKEMVTLYVTESSGLIDLPSPIKGNYYCELVVHNSQNETITIRKSNSIIISDNTIKSSNDNWKEVLTNSNWLSSFSGYTVYE
ncbi:hypothetical protein CJ195_06860 [Bacillus sp. UMB0899]|uniref:hypothetical protein n=1 Tax=Metabacillus schmidteae TaxID=2730405 RepID=UPI000C7FF9BD|nr:hypothetical protein [Metabacillus schmidteae]PMC39631.1 hypothetical protein CJ195_06860 [Bacillus sp. UMB0899]